MIFSMSDKIDIKALLMKMTKEITSNSILCAHRLATALLEVRPPEKHQLIANCHTIKHFQL